MAGDMGKEEIQAFVLLTARASELDLFGQLLEHPSSFYHGRSPTLLYGT